jgi:hypothetical protein
MVYISVYLVEVDIDVPHTWDDKYTKKMRERSFLGKGLRKKFKVGP